MDEKSKAAVDLSKFNLNERQLEIVKYIKEGKSNKEMADLMFISENTVKYHLKNIYEILQIENRMMIK
ncbi:MAG: helix-turn-helix transcriptional regulator [Saprospiraceae bacterium]|nr:helix-turn-helix transcriptional regulator [Saprospiraceae bacterium]